jgi:5-(carboxyamino)imidazole ribonucleotide mutase
MNGVRVGIIMGSDSDWSIAAPARDILDELGVASEVRVLSAHRTAHQLLEYGSSAAERGLGVLIGAAGGAAHLPGLLASVTTLPVIGLPVPLARLDGLDSLLSIVQMPAGIPVATVAIGAGQNAGLLAARILSVSDPALRQALLEHQRGLAERSLAKDVAVQTDLASPE